MDPRRLCLSPLKRGADEAYQRSHWSLQNRLVQVQSLETGGNFARNLADGMPMRDHSVNFMDTLSFVALTYLAYLEK